jgi:hypothetical protein
MGGARRGGAIPVPFIGPIIGAAAGAGYAYVKGKKRS